MANITKRKDSYLIRVSCGYDTKGKQIFKCMTWKPLQGMTKRQIERELQKQALDFEEKCQNGLVSNNPRLTFAEFVPEYLKIVKARLSPSTYEYYKRALNNYVIPLIGHLKLTAIRPVHIQNFVNAMSNKPTAVHKDKQGNTKEQKKISASTVRRYLTIVQSVLNQAVKLDLIQSSPAKSEKLTIPKMQTPKIDIFTKQETAEMLTYLEKEPLQYQVLIQLAIMTGARRGELVALKFSDFDYTNNKVTIERSAYKLKGKPIQIKPPKDYETRIISINQYCLDLIEMLKAEKRKEALRLGDQWKGDEWLFTQWNGEIMNPMTPTKWFSDFLAANNLKHRKFHSLRHTSATLLLYGGINIKQVQGRLGHGDIETTNKYLHYISEADEEAVNVLQNMLITHTQNTSELKQKQA